MSAAFPNVSFEYDVDYDKMTEEDKIELPKFSVLEKLRKFRLRNNTLGQIRLKELATAIEDKGKLFAENWKAISEDMLFPSWFSDEHYPKAIGFVGGIMGILALPIALYLCCTSLRHSGLIRSMMFIATPATTHAAPAVLDLTGVRVSLDLKSLAYITLSHLAVVLCLMAIIHSGRRVIRYCFRQANFLIVHPELRRHPKVEIFLELWAGRERQLIYVFTVKAPVSQLKFRGKLTREHFNLDNHRWYSVLRPSWSAAECSLRVRNLDLVLPCMIPIALHRRKKIQKILNLEFESDLIATDSLYFYRLTDNETHVLNERQPYAHLIKELKERRNRFGFCNDDDNDRENPFEIISDRNDSDGNPFVPSAPLSHTVSDVS